jgi:hypothetical protein
VAERVGKGRDGRLLGLEEAGLWGCGRGWRWRRLGRGLALGRGGVDLEDLQRAELGQDLQRGG